MNDNYIKTDPVLKSENLLNDVFRQIETMISVSDVAGNIIYQTKTWEDFFSNFHTDNQSLNFLSFLNISDRKKWDNLFNHAVREKKNFSFQAQLSDNKNYNCTVMISAAPHLSTENILNGFIFTLKKLSGINAAMPMKEVQEDNSPEEKSVTGKLSLYSTLLEHILQTSDDLITVYDTEMRIVMVNKKVEDILSMKKSQLVGRSLTEIFPDSKNSQSYRDLSRAIRGEHIHNPELDAPITKRIIENFLIPVKNEKGIVEVVLIIAHDNTSGIKAANDLRLANLSLEEKNKELERSNKELASFTYVASHDLQEPLRKIQSFGKRILEKEIGGLSETGKDYFNRMISASMRMQELMEALLQFSRTATLERNFQNSDLNILIEEVKKELIDSIEEKKATLDISPLQILSVIPFQFKQMVSNIISNSLKYSRVGVPAKIQITSDIVSSNDINPNLNPPVNYFQLRIRDNGIGFEEAYGEKIFELFHRLHGRSEYAGSGIGLSICKKIAENHSGFIKAHGIPGEGAVFNIYIPLKHL